MAGTREGLSRMQRVPFSSGIVSWDVAGMGELSVLDV